MSELLKFLCEKVPQFRISRLPALYSDFSLLRYTNPDGYIANVSAWLEGLAAATRAGVIPTISKTPDILSLFINQELLQALETEHGRPLALGTAVREGILKGQFIYIQDFMNASPTIYKRFWNIRPWDFVAHGFEFLGICRGPSGNDQLPVGKLVVLENLEAAGNEVKKKFANFQGRTEKVFTRASFIEKFGFVLGSKTPLSESDVELFLKFLSRDMALISYKGDTIKLKTSSKIEMITFEDETVASLKDIIQNLHFQIRNLSRKIEEETCKAKIAVSKSSRLAAIAALKSKKFISQTLEKRYATLAQLEEVFSKIEQASDQIEVVRIMEASTAVLKGLNQEIGNLDRVENVVDNLQEQMKLVDEVDLRPEFDLALDEREFDDELESMIQDEKEKMDVTIQNEKSIEDMETRKRLDLFEDLDLQSHRVKENLSADSEVQELARSTEILKNLSLNLETNTAN